MRKADKHGYSVVLRENHLRTELLKVDATNRNRTGGLTVTGKVLYLRASVDKAFECKLPKCTSSVAQTAIPMTGGNLVLVTA